MSRPLGFVETSFGNTKQAKMIRPDDIVLSADGSCGLFDHPDTKLAAGRLVSLMRLIVHWKPFSVEFFQTHYRANRWDTGHMFHGLSGPQRNPHAVGGFGQAGYVQLMPDGKCSVTDVFILRCAMFEAVSPQVQYS